MTIDKGGFKNLPSGESKLRLRNFVKQCTRDSVGIKSNSTRSINNFRFSGINFKKMALNRNACVELFMEKELINNFSATQRRLNKLVFYLKKSILELS